MDEITRTEKFLRACIDGEPCALKPLTRVEKLLAELNDKLAGGPAEVVILPDTEMTLEGEATISFNITTPLSATPTEGAMCEISLDGVTYEYPAIYVSVEGMKAYCFGNLQYLGFEGGDASASFAVALFPAGIPLENGTLYGMLNFADGDFRKHATLSIVQVGAASGGGAEPGYLYINGVAESISSTNPVNVTMDTPFETVLAAMQSGRPVFCSLSGYNSAMVYVLQGMGYAAEIGMIVLACNYQTKVEVTWSSAGTCTARLL